MDIKKLEVCLSPALYGEYENKEAITVVVDILRATSAICAALENGARSIIPVGTVEAAREFKQKGYLVAAERDGYILDFADFGNSPFNFSRENIEGRDIAYSTTNGTRTIEMAASSFEVVIGSFLNISSLTDWLVNSGRDVIILCAGWKNKVNLEDSFFAGALTDRLINSGRYRSDCDSTAIVSDLWNSGKDNLLLYIDRAAQRSRLRDKGLDDCIPYCHTADVTSVIPVYRDGSLVCIQ
jgi:2-phosphosulfolactate phosphatase